MSSFTKRSELLSQRRIDEISAKRFFKQDFFTIHHSIVNLIISNISRFSQDHQNGSPNRKNKVGDGHPKREEPPLHSGAVGLQTPCQQSLGKFLTSLTFFVLLSLLFFQVMKRNVQL
jgi:hypothetical protein